MENQEMNNELIPFLELEENYDNNFFKCLVAGLSFYHLFFQYCFIKKYVSNSKHVDIIFIKMIDQKMIDICEDLNVSGYIYDINEFEGVNLKCTKIFNRFASNIIRKKVVNKSEIEKVLQNTIKYTISDCFKENAETIKLDSISDYFYNLFCETIDAYNKRQIPQSIIKMFPELDNKFEEKYYKLITEEPEYLNSGNSISLMLYNIHLRLNKEYNEKLNKFNMKMGKEINSIFDSYVFNDRDTKNIFKLSQMIEALNVYISNCIYNEYLTKINKKVIMFDQDLDSVFEKEKKEGFYYSEDLLKSLKVKHDSN